MSKERLVDIGCMKIPAGIPMFPYAKVRRDYEWDQVVKAAKKINSGKAGKASNDGTAVLRKTK